MTTAHGFIRKNNDATFWLIAPISSKLIGETTPLGTKGQFLKGDVILEAFVNVRTAEATATDKTIDVGLDAASGSENDPDGLLDGVSTAAIGVVAGSLASGGQTRGALLREDEGGGVLVPKTRVIAVDDAVLTYTLPEAATQLEGEICVLVARLPVDVDVISA